jgi:membrane protein DedA with SNARE-associated domain
MIGQGRSMGEAAAAIHAGVEPLHRCHSARGGRLARAESRSAALPLVSIPGMIPAIRGGPRVAATKHGARGGGRRLTEELIREFGYVGIALILILGGLGLPIPEEAPIILAAILTRNGQMSVLPAVASCLIGVLLGDFVVYLLGYCYGEKVLRFPLTRRFLTRQREAQIKGYFHRHGFKILVSGRFVPGFRSAAYLTAGILKLPTLRLLMTDMFAAALSTSLMFGLGFLFANQIQKGIHEVQQWLTLLVAAGIASWLLYRYYQARRRAGQPVGPPVLDVDEIPLPPLDMMAKLGPPEPLPAAASSPDGGDPAGDAIEHEATGCPGASNAAARPESPVDIDLANPSPPTTVPSSSR